MSYESHHAHAPAPVSVAVLTVSDTKGPLSDTSGQTIVDGLEKAGHRAAGRAWTRDEKDQIRQQALRLLEAADSQALVVTGGTGVGPRDVTIEALSGFFEPPLPGFGEAFRRLTWDEIGSGGMLSRADAGIVARGGRRKPVFLLPGAPEACRLAVERIIGPELGHLVEVANGAERRPR